MINPYACSYHPGGTLVAYSPVMVATTLVAYSPLMVACSPSNGLPGMLVTTFLIVATSASSGSYHHGGNYPFDGH